MKKKIAIYAKSAKTEYMEIYDKEGNVLIFGVASAIISLVTGSFLFLYFASKAVSSSVKLIGLVWMIYSGLVLIGIELFERSRKKEAAAYLIALGLVGVIFGVGFFLGALLTIFTGVLALKYHYGLHKK